MAYTAEIFGSAIVAVGSFNPAIFTPDWFEKHNLMGPDDAASARTGDFAGSLIVSQDATVFETKWFSLQVLRNQLALTSKDVVSPAFRDLAVGTFQLIPHTPVKGVGLNFLAHFRLADDKAHHVVGDCLAPKEIWGELYPDRTAGMQEVTIKIQDWKRGEPTKTKDELRITVQPSARIKYGVFFSYNDHHELEEKDADGQLPGERAARTIERSWAAAREDAVRSFDGVLTKILGPRA